MARPFVFAHPVEVLQRAFEGLFHGHHLGVGGDARALPVRTPTPGSASTCPSK